MADRQRPSSGESRLHGKDVVQVALLRRRSRSRALLVVLLGLVALFYAMTVTRFGQQAAVRDAASAPRR